MVHDRDTASTWETAGQTHAAAASRWVALQVLFHPDLQRIGDEAPLFELGRAASRQLSRTELEFRSMDGRPSGPLATRRVSREPVSFRQTVDGQLTVEGATEIFQGSTRLQPGSSLTPEALQQGVTLGMGSHLVLWLCLVPEERPRVAGRHGLVGVSPAMEQVRAEIDQMARLEVPVLLRGETGTGKELVASAIHHGSARASKRLVAVNMSAIPTGTAAAELFGHSRGAFTGAFRERGGYFREANGSTLFLDEIGDTPDDIQPMLLRAIEERVIQPLGGSPEPVDVRVVAATDSNLEAAIHSGQFRSPLLRRFGYSIHLPALRERAQDLGLLFVHFLAQELALLQQAGRAVASPADESHTWLPGGLGLRLASHAWPGNIRELRNVVRRIVIRSGGRPGGADPPLTDRELGLLEAKAAPSVLRPKSNATVTEPTKPKGVRAPLPTPEAIAAAWQAAEYDDVRAAQALGVGRTWLRQKLKTCPGVTLADDLDAPTIGLVRKHNPDLASAAKALGVSQRALVMRLRKLGLERA